MGCFDHQPYDFSGGLWILRAMPRKNPPRNSRPHFSGLWKHWFPLIRPNIRALFHLISWGKRGLGESPLDCHDKTARCPGVKRLSTFNELPSLKLTAILHLKMDGMGRRLFPFLLGQQAYFRVRSVSFSDLHGNSTPANLLKGAGCSGIFGTMNQRFTKLRVNPPGCHVKTPQEL